MFGGGDGSGQGQGGPRELNHARGGGGVHYKKNDKHYIYPNVVESLDKHRKDPKTPVYGNKYRTHRNYGAGPFVDGGWKTKANKKEYDKWYHENVRKTDAKGIDRAKGSQPGSKGNSSKGFIRYLRHNDLGKKKD